MSRTIPHGTSLNEVEDVLSRLVSIDTSNPPGREKRCAEYVERTLSSWGIETQLVREPFPDRPQLIAKVGRGELEKPTLVLNGHMDVVPPGDTDEWSRDPFGGEIEGGRIYGRGATDMKGGLTAAMLAARAAAEIDDLAGTLVLAFAVGEETGDPGTLRLIESLDADFGVVLEPTNLAVHTASKGTAWYTVTVQGESAHASRPHRGANPLLALLSMTDRIEGYRARLAETAHPLLGEPTCTPTVCAAGSKENVIPSTAEIRFDRRFLPSEDIAKIDAEIGALFEPIRDGFEINVERTTTFEPAETPADENIVDVFLKLSTEFGVEDAGPAGKVGATDQRFFVNQGGIPAIVWGPGDPDRAHTIDEFAESEPILRAVKVLCRAFEDLLTGEE